MESTCQVISLLAARVFRYGSLSDPNIENMEIALHAKIILFKKNLAKTWQERRLFEQRVW